MKRWGVSFLCLAFLSPAAWSADLNTIVKVEVRGSTVEIVGSKQPSFTTFTMTDPPRLVVDIGEAVFSGVPDQLPGSGVVSWIKTASYGSDASAIARVLIAFSKEVDTDLTTAGGKLVVKIIDAPVPVVARADKAPTEAPAQTQASPKLQLAAGSETSDAAPAESAKRDAKLKEAFAKAQQKDEAEAQRQAQLEREEQSRRAAEEARRQREAEKARRAEEERAAEQQRVAQAEEAQRQRTAEAKRKTEEERLAREKARAEAEAVKREEAAEAKRKAEEERLARLQAQAEAEAAKRQAAAEAKHKADEERLARQQSQAEAEAAKRQAAAEAKQKVQEERRAKEVARAEAERAKREAAAEAKRKAEAERIARAKAKAEQVELERQAAQEARASKRSRATMTFVGFERASSGSRVYVRTTGPVQYSVQEDGDKKVILELENTRIALRNNRRPLDTSFFDSAVAMVAPASVGKATVRVEIKLKEHASFQATQNGNEVSIEFPRASRR